MRTLEDIKARLAAATPGPWENDGGGDIGQHFSRPEPWRNVVSTEVSCGSYCLGGSAAGVEHEADAEFIANAPTDIAALAAALEAVIALSHSKSHENDTDPLIWGSDIRARINEALGEK